MTNTMTRTMVWQQIVPSRSGGTPHNVRHFDDGLTTCDCKGYEYRNKCAHLSIAAAQQEREDKAWQVWLDSQGLDRTHEGPVLVDDGPEPFDGPSEVRAAGRKAYEDLFGAAA